MRLLALLVFVAVSACAPRLAITRHLPSPVDLGDVQRITIEVPARQGAPDLVDLFKNFQGLVTGGSADPDEVRDEVGSALAQKLTANGAYVIGGAPDAVLTVVLGSWHLAAVEAEMTVSHQREAQGRLVAVLRITRPDGSALVPPREYDVKVDAPLPPAATIREAGLEQPLQDRAAAELAARIAYDVAPTSDTRAVALADDDPRVAVALKHLQAGDGDAARAEYERVLAVDPQAAAALHGLGVLAEGQSDFPTAFGLYSRAEAASPRQLFRDAIRRVEGLRKVTPRAPTP